MTTPAGLPAATRTAAIEYYGGSLTKKNYMSQGSINPDTDVGADQICRMSADITAIARVIPFATIIYQNNDTSPDDPTVLQCMLQTGVVLGGYEGDNPPTGFPTLTRTGNGDVDIDFPVTMSDDFSVSFTTDLHLGIGSAMAGASADFDISKEDPNADGYYERMRVQVLDNGGAVQDALVCISFW